MSNKPVLKSGSTGPDVTLLQEKLRHASHAVRVTGQFDSQTQIAVVAFQKARGLTADGIVGEKTWVSLESASTQKLKCGAVEVRIEDVFEMCPESPRANVEKFLPEILSNLEKRGLGNAMMIRLAIATVYTETRGFAPLAEFQSKFNTSPGGKPFDLYDSRKDLGNQGPGDGERFKGRGFIQLTGRANYMEYGALLGLNLVSAPEQANSPGVAAAVLCEYLKKRETSFAQALQKDDYSKARKLVNGGTHGLDVFTASYKAWEKKSA